MKGRISEKKKMISVRPSVFLNVEERARPKTATTGPRRCPFYKGYGRYRGGGDVTVAPGAGWRRWHR